MMFEGRFVLRTADTDELVGVDQDSGGYPYVPSWPGGVKFWPTIEEAKQYAAHWPGKYKVCVVKVFRTQEVS